MNTFLGTSLAFPIRPNGRGGIATVSGVAAVEDSLRAIISSMRGSHLFEPWLGVPPFVFRPIEDLLAIAEIFKDAIADAEDRVDPAVLEVEVAIGDEGLVQVAVTYDIKGDATPRTLQQGFRLLEAS